MNLYERLEQIATARAMDVAAIRHTLQVMMVEDQKAGQKLLGPKMQAAITIRAEATGNGSERTLGDSARGKRFVWGVALDFLRAQPDNTAQLKTIAEGTGSSRNSLQAAMRTHKDLFRTNGAGIYTLTAKAIGNGKAAASPTPKAEKVPKVAQAAKLPPLSKLPKDAYTWERIRAVLVRRPNLTATPQEIAAALKNVGAGAISQQARKYSKMFKSLGRRGITLRNEKALTMVIKGARRTAPLEARKRQAATMRARFKRAKEPKLQPVAAAPQLESVDESAEVAAVG